MAQADLNDLIQTAERLELLVRNGALPEACALLSETLVSETADPNPDAISIQGGLAWLFDRLADAVVEVGSAGNADRIHAHFESLPVNLFAQNTAWQRVEKRADMPESHRDGSLFISTKDAMPWF